MENRDQTQSGVVVDAATVQEVVEQQSNYEVIKKELIAAAGSNYYKGVKIRNTTISEQDDYDRISFSLSNKIAGYTRDDDGNYKEGKTDVMYTSTFAMSGILKENEEISFLANNLIENPKIATMLFNGAKLDIVQVKVAAGVPHKNPFSRQDGNTSKVYDHDIYISYIVGIKFGKTGDDIVNLFKQEMVKKALGF